MSGPEGSSTKKIFLCDMTCRVVADFGSIVLTEIGEEVLSVSYLALYRKHRPQNFDQIVGQRAVVTALKNQVKYGQIGHAYLFCGTRGTGKTSTAKVFARAVNCLHPVDGNPCNECELCREAESGFNVIEIDAASNNGVDNIRDLREEVQYTPSQGRYKVYIIDEVHMLSTAAFNALLKTLEEPPEHAIFVLATTDPQKVLPTIVSRCQRYDFRRITTQDILSQLKKVCEAEGIEADEAALSYIAALSDGGMRDALSILDQCHAYYIDKPITLQDVEEVLGAVDDRIFTQMTDALASRDVAGLLDGVARVFDTGRDALQFVVSWTGYLRNLLVAKVLGNQAERALKVPADQQDRLKEQATGLTPGQISAWIEALAKLETQLKTASSRRILIEVALIRLSTGTYERAVTAPAPAYRGEPAPAARFDAASAPRMDEAPVQAGSAAPRDIPAAAPRQQAVPMAASMASPRPMAVPAAATQPSAAFQPMTAPAAAPQPMAAPQPSAAGGPSDEDTQRVVASWPSLREEFYSRNPNLFSLKFIDMRAGQVPGELLLTTGDQIYLDQLNYQNGQKLKDIENFIAQKTGRRYTIRLVKSEQNQHVSWTREDFSKNIHMNIDFQ